jgi:hypothetical protein
MRIIIVIFFFLAVLNIFATGKREEKSGEQFSPVVIDSAKDIDGGDEIHNGPCDMITIVGIVQIYGADPSTFVGIVDQDGTEYAIYPPEKERELRALQGHLIEFQVIFENGQENYGGLFLGGGTVIPVKWKVLQ